MSLLPWNVDEASLAWAVPSAPQWWSMVEQAWADWAIQLALVYVLLQPLMSWLFADGALYSKHKGFWKNFMFAHNAALAVYSLATFVWSLWSLNEGSRGAGIASVLFDRTDHTRVWSSPGWADLSWWFWMSKYWEYLDTIFLIVAGKPVSFLQFFHHLGAGLVLWILVRYENSEIWIFICFNSFIHTLMYTYYAASVKGVNLALVKWIMTLLQILQLFIGGLIISVWHPMNQPTYRQSWTQVGSMMFSQAYIVVLFLLFVQFFIESYVAPKAKRTAAPTKKTN